MTPLLAIRFTVVAFVSLAPELLRKKGALGLGGKNRRARDTKEA
jgi:hypothetical protein